MTNTIHPETTIGLVALSVADLERSLDYYQHNIGLTLQAREGDVATLGAGARPLLRLTEQPGARVMRRATGLFHFALLVPSRLELARTLDHLLTTKTPIAGASDHLVSEALYLSDPDGHGIEIYRDRTRDAWYDAQGHLQMDTLQFDAAGVMAELQTYNGPAWNGLDPKTIMGHIHLQVADVAAAHRFYTEVLGFEHMADYPQASFLGAGGYHHHVGVNSWQGVGVPPPPETAARLLSYEIYLPTQTALDEVIGRIQTAELPLEEQADGWVLRDPSHNQIILRTP